MRKSLVEFAGKEKYALLGGVIYCFFVPLFQIASTGAMILWLVLALIGGRREATERRMLLIPIGLFLIYLLSFLFAPSDAYDILERKLSLIVFPLIFYFSSYTREDRILLFKGFLLGLTASGIFCIAVAIFRSFDILEGAITFQPEVLSGKGFFESILYGGNYFFGRYLSVFHQTVYYAIYLCIGIAVLLHSDDIVRNKYRKWGLFGFFVLLIFLVSNKAGFLGLAGILFLFIMQKVRKPSMKIALVVTLVLASCIYMLANPRMKESVGDILAGKIELDRNARYGFSTRLLSWNASLNLIRERPVRGYGVAHAQDALDAEYKRLEYAFPLREHLNAHNQFLQFWIETGIIGFISWGLIVVFLYFRAIHFSLSNKYLILSFVLLLLVNSLFESVMNRFSGISFISFFLCFLLTMNKDET
jgi:O-antigen ligase